MADSALNNHAPAHEHASRSLVFSSPHYAADTLIDSACPTKLLSPDLQYSVRLNDLRLEAIQRLPGHRDRNICVRHLHPDDFQKHIHKGFNTAPPASRQRRALRPAAL